MDAADRIHEALSVRADRGSRFLLALAAACLAIALVLLAAGYAGEQIRPTKWDPLGAYPLQTVINRNHLVHVDGTVDVVAQKCARVKQVNVRTSKAWVPVNRIELAVADTPGKLDIRYRSCGPTVTQSTFGFHNPIPEQVKRLVAGGYHVWRITGTDTPFDSKGREGVPRTWATETFTIV